MAIILQPAPPPAQDDIVYGRPLSGLDFVEIRKFLRNSGIAVALLNI